MTHALPISDDHDVMIVNPTGTSPVVVVCEHASCFIPAGFDGLGLTPDARHSHAVWDPGALRVATGLADRLDAALVAATVSRGVYDCNRPPSAADAIPVQSETINIPGNADLTPAQRSTRADRYYTPFRTALARVIATKPSPIIVTIHSFTPVYHGTPRRVEIGVLHDRDTRLADAMLDSAPRHTGRIVLRNAPYGPDDGVTHTLKEHALPKGHPNVMLEVRNDLIQTEAEQDAMAACIAAWLSDALAHLHPAEAAQ